MKETVVFTDEAEKAQAMANNPTMRVIGEQRHIVGKDEEGNDIWEEALILTDEPEELTLEQKVATLEAKVAALEAG